MEKKKNGVNYYFLSREEFEQEIENDEFLEYAEYSKNYYGTPKKYIKEHLDNGEDVIFRNRNSRGFKGKRKRLKKLYLSLYFP